MKLIRKRCNGFVIMFLANFCFAMLLSFVYKEEMVFLFGTISLISLLFLVRQNRLLYDASLIWENRILVVPSIAPNLSGRQIQKDTEETVVSTFGILLGKQIYRWGLDGIHGIRLQTTLIDKERIYLTFGDAAQIMRLEMLHGMSQKKEVIITAQKLLYETGVQADIIGW